VATKDKQHGLGGPNKMKSIHNKLNEALAAIDKAGKRKQYNEAVRPEMTTETRLNAAESILNATISNKFGEAAKPVNQFKANADALDEALSEPGVAILFGKTPKTTKENATPIKKNAGAAEMFVEGSPFNGDRSNTTVVPETKKDVYSKGDKALADGLLKLGKITEAEHAKLTGNARPQGYEKLSEKQKKEYDFARLIGINESDAFKVARLSR
jgi:hypothetical protein